MHDKFVNLPHDVRFLAGFSGRRAELNRLSEWFSGTNQKVAFLHGEIGSGKTSLARAFIETSKNAFPGGVYYSYGTGPESPDRFVQRTISARTVQRSLWIIDEADNLPIDQRSQIPTILAGHTNLNLLLVGVMPFQLANREQATIELGALTHEEFRELIAKRLSHEDEAVVQQLWESFGGRAIIAGLAGATLREGLRSLTELAAELTDFYHPGFWALMENRSKLTLATETASLSKSRRSTMS